MNNPVQRNVNKSNSELQAMYVKSKVFVKKVNLSKQRNISLAFKNSPAAINKFIYKDLVLEVLRKSRKISLNRAMVFIKESRIICEQK